MLATVSVVTNNGGRGRERKRERERERERGWDDFFFHLLVYKYLARNRKKPVCKLLFRSQRK